MHSGSCRHGHAFTLIAGEDDEKAILAIEKLTGEPIPVLSNTDRQSKKEHSTDDARKSAKKQRESRTLNKTASNQLDPEEKNPDEVDKVRSRRSEQGEKRPPAWKGNSFKDGDHFPAFLP